MMVSAQFSVCLRGQEDPRPAVGSACRSLQGQPVRHDPVSMSSLAESDLQAVLAALERVLVSASEGGATVMTCTISNAYPRALPGAPGVHQD